MKLNFTDSISNILNSIYDGIADHMYSSMMSSYEGQGRRVDTELDIFNPADIDPNIYYDMMKNYSYLNALLKAYTDPIKEVISKSSFELNHPDKKVAASANAKVSKSGLKTYILDHLDDIVLRGSYSGFINDTSISEILNSSKNVYISKSGKFLMLKFNESEVTIPFYEVYTYWYKPKVLELLTISDVEKIKKHADALNPMIDDKDEPTSSDSANKMLDEFKKSVTVDTVKFVGRSLFDPHLHDIFRIYIREFIYDVLSLSDYLKSVILTVTVSSQKPDTRKSDQIINSIESLVNADNLNVISSYSDPHQLISIITEKLVNRLRVLPEIQDYSSIQEFHMPDTQAILDKLKNDIDSSKRSLENQMSIPEEIISGTGNRWEIAAKSEKYADALVTVLYTISESAKRFCTATLYKESYDKDPDKANYVPSHEFSLDFNIEEYFKPYLNRTKLSTLNDKMKDLIGLLSTISEVSGLEGLDTAAFIKYLSSALSEADPGLSGMIRVEDIVKKGTKSSISRFG